MTLTVTTNNGILDISFCRFLVFLWHVCGTRNFFDMHHCHCCWLFVSFLFLMKAFCSPHVLMCRCQKIGKGSSSAKCNTCCGSSSLAMCLDCSRILCDRFEFLVSYWMWQYFFGKFMLSAFPIHSNSPKKKNQHKMREQGRGKNPI